jgi:hypothetical protein
MQATIINTLNANKLKIGEIIDEKEEDIFEDALSYFEENDYSKNFNTIERTDFISPISSHWISLNDLSKSKNKIGHLNVDVHPNTISPENPVDPESNSNLEKNYIKNDDATKSVESTVKDCIQSISSSKKSEVCDVPAEVLITDSLSKESTEPKTSLEANVVLDPYLDTDVEMELLPNWPPRENPFHSHQTAVANTGIENEINNEISSETAEKLQAIKIRLTIPSICEYIHCHAQMHANAFIFVPEFV